MVQFSMFELAITVNFPLRTVKGVVPDTDPWVLRRRLNPREPGSPGTRCEVGTAGVWKDV